MWNWTMMKIILPTIITTTIIARLMETITENNTLPPHPIHYQTIKMPTSHHPHQSHQHVPTLNTSHVKLPPPVPVPSHPHPYLKPRWSTIPDMSSPEYPSVLYCCANGNKPFGFNMDQLNFCFFGPIPITKIGSIIPTTLKRHVIF